ncbi:MAG: 50S ribosomal protein L13 [Candidatus Caldatribacteriota bacterium]|nr:50S ribosomal protein L13 [Atribacterota bacterium]MDD3640688.1 50S ribosomal protein L13 [Atribacterota bacterium]MDD4288470.1 50S ribosomal protein L13 [Atribacterota bacterium]MDD4764303.1 50S ribosomal protein L13 [Atribacterota bacterium]MDD5635950.1 50S ribosomal protein L13 [Atribacterota bacterium]
MKTFREKQENIQRNWYLFDAKGKILGRLATEVASILRGKNKVVFDQSQDLGDYVVVINAEKVKVTGNKAEQKLYRHHTGYPGSLKEVKFEEMIEKKPEMVIEKAVKGMLPKNKLSRSVMKKLKVYRGDKHPHTAQEVIVIN